MNVRTKSVLKDKAEMKEATSVTSQAQTSPLKVLYSLCTFYNYSPPISILIMSHAYCLAVAKKKRKKSDVL